MNNLNNLVTTYNFRGKDYLVSLNAPKLNPGNMEIKVTDKRTIEEWIGSFSASYIENLTQKTGNYKRFDTFMAMVKSGLLSTSQCVTLDLLTFEDLELLKNKKHQVRNFAPSYSSNLSTTSNNRRYLIVTYTVEFDRIHFPLALEYCGPPDPKILQDTIISLEKQVVHLQQQLEGNHNWEDISSQIDSLQRKVVEVTSENIMLKEHLNSVQKSKYCLKNTDSFLKTIHNLESKLRSESDKVNMLRIENSNLTVKLEEAMRTQKMLRIQLSSFNSESSCVKNKLPKSKHISKPISPMFNRSLDNITGKPFRRRKVERKLSSARSHLSATHSSSEESLLGEGDRSKTRNFKFLTKPRASSPTLSDLSHNSGFSRCACRNCLRVKYGADDNLRLSGSRPNKKLDKVQGRTTLLKRIQSLEKLISGMVLK